MRNHKTTPALYYLLLFVFFMGNLHAEQNIRSNRVYLNTREFREFRRVYIQMPFSENSTVVDEPIVYQKDGKHFLLTLDIADTALFIGSKMLEDAGDHPVKLNISFADSAHLLIDGETNGYYEIKAYYSFENRRYIFDIFWKQPVETAFDEKSIIGDRLPEDQIKMIDVLKTRKKPGNMQNINPVLFNQSRIITSVVLALSLLLIIGISTTWFVLKKRKDTPSVKRNKKSVVPNTRKSTKQNYAANEKSSDDQIRDLADKKGLSYDEASIVINMSKEEFDNE